MLSAGVTVRDGFTVLAQHVYATCEYRKGCQSWAGMNRVVDVHFDAIII